LITLIIDIFLLAKPLDHFICSFDAKLAVPSVCKSATNTSHQSTAKKKKFPHVEDVPFRALETVQKPTHAVHLSGVDAVGKCDPDGACNSLGFWLGCVQTHDKHT